MTLKIAVAAGDGIGPEVMAQALRVVDTVVNTFGLHMERVPIAIGGSAYVEYGSPLPSDALNVAKSCDAVLLGAVGGPQFDDAPRESRPEAGLLLLRSELETFANIRPALCFEAMVDASTLKPEVISGLDLIIVRELTSGVYFGQPRGNQTLPDGTHRVIDTQAYTAHEIQRVLAVATQMARTRSGVVHCVDKANVMETGKFWRDICAQWAQSPEAKGVTFKYMYADNCAMQLVRAPKQFDVIVTDNLFGDILSDCAAMLTGSLGMLPSASLAAITQNNVPKNAIYEPVHGSAPDIAGTNTANPLAMILCVAMLMRYSAQRSDIALCIENAVAAVLDQGWRTQDILSTHAKNKAVSTSAITDRVIESMVAS